MSVRTISKKEVQQALIDYFKDGGRPSDIIDIVTDAWEIAIYDINLQGTYEIDQLHKVKL